MKRILASVAFLVAAMLPFAAEAKVNVVTTVQTFKLITQYIGGNNVNVTSLVGDDVDPHFVDAKPTYAKTLSSADLLVFVGLDLEVGWLPPLLEQARNPNIQSGQTGNLDISTVIPSILDQGGDTSRKGGDIHPFGNPHYWLAPANAKAAARAIADRLKTLDSKNADYYEKREQKFEKKLAEKEKDWADLAKPLKGVKVVTYHKSWTYLMDYLGMQEIGYIEPKPGVPPDPQHLAQLVRDAKSQGAKYVIVESYYPQATAKKVADLAGMKLVVLPSDAKSGVSSYFDLVELLITTLVNS